MSENLLEKIKDLSPEKRALLEKMLAKKRETVDLTKMKIGRFARQPEGEPLSFAQQRLWFLDQLDPHNPSYNIADAVRLEGVIDPAVLKEALMRLVERHESLRTTFAMVDEDPVQIIAVAPTLDFEVVSLVDLPSDAGDMRVRALVDREAATPFDLAVGPLFRTRLILLAEREAVLVLNMHHIISDGWSMGILIQELGAIYQALAAGQPIRLPELPIQYADFAQWQRQTLKGLSLQKQLDYWRTQLGDGNDLLNLPTDRSRPPISTGAGASVNHLLPKGLADGLNQLAQQEKGTLFMVLLAAFQLLLHRLSGQERINVGSPIANRNRVEVEGVIGFFVNTLVFSTRFEGNRSFRSLVQQVHEMTVAAYDNQDLPFEMLVEELQPTRDMSYNPLFQVMFMLQNLSTEPVELPNLTLTSLEADGGTANFDLTLAAYESEAGLHLNGEYSTDLFERETIERFLSHFEQLLRGIVADPDRPILDLPLLTADEQKLIVHRWNETERARPGLTERSVVQIFEEQAINCADAPAVQTLGDEISYAALNRRANRLAHYLLTQGVRPETVVGISHSRSVDLLVAVLGVLKAGGAYLPIDPNYPAERLEHIVSDSGIEILITESGLEKKPAFAGLQPFLLDQSATLLADMPSTNPTVQVRPETLAYMIYTSGSTGRPKGVMVEHRNLSNALLAWDEAFDLSSLQSHLQMANFAFDVFTADWVRALCFGARLVLCPRDWLLEPQKLYELIDTHKIDSAEFVPAVLRQLVEYMEQQGGKFDHLKILSCGSDSWYIGEYRRFLDFCGPETRLINSFGLTEGTIDSSYYEKAWQADEPAPANDQMVPIGKPFANMRFYILDQQRRPTPIGVPGELYIGGRGVARGYHNRPELNRERFLPDPFVGDPAARIYKTGDQARYLPDGNVEFLGRLDNQLKIRGFRIEPGEVEAAVEQHPDVVHTAVVGKKVKNGELRLVAYVVLREEREQTLTILRRFLQERLPDYMVPATFVSLQEIPLTPNGKVDRRALPEPDWSERMLEALYVAPRNPQEERMAEIWSELLDVETVGVFDNFFELGGHSLLATRLISRIRASFEVELPVRSLFEAPTVAGLLEQTLSLGLAPQAPPILIAAREGQLPLSFAQQRLWFIDQFEPNSSAYNLPEAVRVSGRLDSTALDQALQSMVERHEPLRTTFQTDENGQPFVRIAPSASLCFETVDLSDMPDPLEQKRRSQGVIEQQLQRPFNLATGPLLRPILIKLEEEEHIVLLVMHHIITDGWSTGIFLEELTTLYAAHLAGMPNPLPSMPLQYVDFAVWQRNWLAGETLDRYTTYWSEQLAGMPPLLELPTDFKRPAEQHYRGADLHFALSPELSQAVYQFCRQAGVTPFMVLLATFQTVLGRYARTDDVVVGTPIANRNRTEIEGMIGFFVNTLVLRGDLSGDPTFRELALQTRETTLDAYAYQDLPFENLVDLLQPERSPAYNPLFQVMFALQNVPEKRVEFDDVTFSGVEIGSKNATFDLSLFMEEEMDQTGAEIFTGTFEYNTDLFRPETVNGLVRHFETLLKGVLARPDQPLGQHSMLTAAEEDCVVRGLNVGALDLIDAAALETTLHGRFEAAVTRYSQSTAVIQPGFLSGDERSLTYEALNRRANCLAHELIARGVGPEVVVGLSFSKSLEMVVGLLAILKAGGAYLPLDPTYPAEQLTYIVTDSQVELILTEASIWSQLEPGVGHASPLFVSDDPTLFADRPATNPTVAVNPEHLAYIIYTSGSTGRPKGVMVNHRSVVNHNIGFTTKIDLQPQDRVLQFATINFDTAVEEIFPTLATGAALVLRSDEVPSLIELSRLLDRYKISVVDLPTGYWHIWVSELEQGGCALSEHLRWVIVGGEKALSHKLSAWLSLTAGHPVRWLNTYGPTEATVIATWWEAPALKVNEKDAGWDRNMEIPIGRPLPNIALYVLDAQQNPVPSGVPGELYIGGAGVVRGYLNRPELTAERFLNDPFQAAPGHTIYKTGDLVRLMPDGNLQFLGRTDYQVKIRGFRVEPEAIETVLDAHPAVLEAAVVPFYLEDRSIKLAAFYLSHAEKSPPQADQLKRYLAAALPAYMVPDQIVLLDEMPRLPNGKLNRNQLPNPGFGETVGRPPYVAPSSEYEHALVSIWETILGVEKIGLHDNFFALGGHSLLATQLVSRVRAQLGVELPVRSLFEAPTVAELAARHSHHQEGTILAPPIVPVARDGALPLSFAQQRLWFIDQLDPDSAAYNVPEVTRIEGGLNLDALKRALQALVARHEILRTTFWTAATGEPILHIADTALIAFEEIDLSDIKDGSAREARVKSLIQSRLERPFALDVGPLLRPTVIRTAPQEHVVLLVLHHIITDGWSSGIFLEELVTLYVAFAQGLPSPLPPLSLQYLDYAAWQRQWLAGETLDRFVDYWRGRLDGLPPLLELPTDFPRPAEQTFRGGAVEIELPAALTTQVAAFCRQEGVTPFMTLLAVYQMLLGRYAGVDDVPVGTPIANRNRAETEEMLGFFVNTLVMRGDLSDRPTFRELVGRTKEVTLGAYDHQDLPFETLVDLLRPERSTSYSPIFQVMFALQNMPDKAGVLSDIAFSPIELEANITNFDLVMALSEATDGAGQPVIIGALEFNRDLFKRETAERLIGHFEILLTRLLAEPDRPIDQFSILTEAETEQILVEWNRTEAPYPDNRTAAQYFEAVANLDRQKVALQFEDQALTYGELDNRANQLAHYLQKRGARPEAVLGLYFDRSPEMMIGLIGTLKSDAAFVPMSTTYPAERIKYILEESQVPILLTQSHLIDRLPPFEAGYRPEIILLDDVWEEIAQEPTVPPPSRATADSLAYIIYTSGSTGKPKGALLEHRGLCNVIAAYIETFGVRPEDRVLQILSFGFDAFLVEVGMGLFSGGTFCIPNDDTILSMPDLHRFLQRHQMTVATMTPSILAALPSENLPDLRLIITGGEALTPELVSIWGEQCHFYNAYGPTEATIATTAFKAEPGGPIYIGRPLMNSTAYILDRHGQPVPIGMPGELFLGGIQIGRGYLNRPALTAERFIQNRFVTDPEARLYRTGDLVRYLPDGNIDFIGRIDHQVKLRGYRIELGEIESVILQHPQVKEVAVLVKKSPTEIEHLVAYVVPHPAGNGAEFETDALSIAALRAHVQTHLPDYMVPTGVVNLSAFPLTPNGKIDRKGLPEPDWTQRLSGGEYLPPRSDSEEEMAALWSELLGVEPIGVFDNFFELGGHSLLATQLISRIRQRFEVDLPVRVIFEAPLLADLTERVLLTPLADLTPALRPVPRGADLPLSFAQQRLWFIHQLDPGSAAYNVPIVLRCDGRLEVDLLDRALQMIVDRHEIMRTTFEKTEEGRPRLQIAATLEAGFELIDMRVVPRAAEREGRTQALIEAELSRPFDLAHGPLLRAKLIQVADEQYVVVLVMHHIITDGWSIGLLFEELTTLYAAGMAGQPLALPSLALQYADFATWQRDWLQGEVLDRYLSYWEQQLADMPPLLELPTDYPRPAEQTENGADVRFELSDALAAKVDAFSQEAGVTPFMTLLATFQILLGRYAGVEDVPVGTPVANRNWAEIEGMIGFFVNTLVLRGDLSGRPTFKELVGRTREVTLDAYAYQDLPFENLVEHLEPERNIAYNPIFQVMFSLQNVPNRQVELPGIALSEVESEETMSTFDLSLVMAESRGTLLGAFEYNTDLFKPATIERMADHFQHLLASLVADPDRPIAAHGLLRPTELAAELAAAQGPTLTVHTQLVHRPFEALAAQNGDHIALVSGEERLTYRALNRSANQLAHYLMDRGVGVETRVGISLNRSADMLVALLAILKSGAAYVPLDPNYPTERLAFMLADSELTHLVTDTPLVKSLPLDRLAQPPVVVLVDQERAAFESRPVTDPAPPLSAENLAYIIYTSGSTGRPKGVMVSHGGVVNHNAAFVREVGLSPDDRVLQFATINFDTAVEEIFPTLAAGATLVIAGREQIIPFDVLEQYIVDYQISVLDLPTAYWESWTTHLEQDGRAAPVPLRLVIVGGEKAHADRLTAWQQLNRGRPIRWLNTYGPTEGTVIATWFTPPEEEIWDPHVDIPIGLPLPNVLVYLLDHHLQPVPSGIPGELYLGGPGVARGYLNRPELTHERFLPNPFVVGQAGALYKTGDLGRRLPDGNIEYLGRVDDQVKIRGFRIEVGEVETALEQHPSLQQSIVVPYTGEGEAKRAAQLVAYSTLLRSTKERPTAAELRDFLATRLPEYMIPATFVTLPELPLLPNGKINRRGLPAPDLSNGLDGRRYVPPTDELEQQLVALWETILKREPIGLEDNFFELGGHSLLSIQLASAINKETRFQLSLVDFFQNPTVGQLAALIRRQTVGGRARGISSIVELKRSGERPPLFMIHPSGGSVHWYFDLAAAFDADRPLIGLQARGLYRDAPLLTSIEEMAAHYVAEIRRYRPQGPYHIAGWSFGAVLAFEVARQLAAHGVSVGALVLLDCTPYHLGGVGFDHTDLLYESFKGSVPSLTLADLRTLSPDAQVAHIYNLGRETDDTIGAISLEEFTQFVRILKTEDDAWRQYTPGPYPGEITVVRASASDVSLPPHLATNGAIEDLGWGALSQRAVSVMTLNGDHSTILHDTEVGALADLLAARLAQSDAQSGQDEGRMSGKDGAV